MKSIRNLTIAALTISLTMLSLEDFAAAHMIQENFYLVLDLIAVPGIIAAIVLLAKDAK